MMKYFSKLYNSLVIYYSIKKSKDLNSLDVLIKESYSLEMRAMCLAADSNSRDIYKIIFSEENTLPYPIYSLNIKKEILIFNNFIEKVFIENKEKIINKSCNNELIIVQSSDSTISSPTTYEYYCYEDIIKAFSSINFRGKIVFNFHPSNSKFSVFIKRIVCILFKRIYKGNFKLRLFHRKQSIETLSKSSSNIISIDYSQCYKFMLKHNKKLINYNRNDSRLYGIVDKKFFESGNYINATNYESLKNILNNLKLYSSDK